MSAAEVEAPEPVKPSVELEAARPEFAPTSLLDGGAGGGERVRIDATPRAGRACPGEHPRRGLRFITFGRAAPLPSVPAPHFVPKDARGL